MPTFAAPGYYQSPYAQAIADSIAAPYRARANAELQAGEASQRGWEQVGHTVNNTLNDIMRFQEDAPRRAGDPAQIVADIGRVQKLLKIRPRYDDLERIVEHALRWEKELQSRK